MPEQSRTARVYDLEERLIRFSAMVMDVIEGLSDTRTGNHVAGQLVRCCTSPAANYAEAQSAESRNDFTHKMKVCLKELRETRVWLLLIQRQSLAGHGEKVSGALAECNELIAIFVTSIKTAQKSKGA